VWRAWKDRRPALGLLLFAVLLPTLLYDGTVLQNMFSLLGEIYTAIFVFAFAVFVWDPEREKARPWPFAFLGLALATKHTHIVGVAPTLLFVVVLMVRDPTIAPDPSGRGRSVFAAKALGLTLGPPILLAMLPRLLLWGNDYELHRTAAEWFNTQIASLALGNLYSLVGYLGGKNSNGLAEIKLNLVGKIGAIVQFKHGVLPLVTWVLLNLLLTVWLMRTRKNIGLACMMLYRTGLFGWWFFLNRLDWYRYFFSADIALALALCASVPCLLDQFRSGPPSKRRAVLACTLVACAYLLGTFSALNWRGQWSSIALTGRFRSAQARVAQLVSQGNRDDAAFFGIGWFQAPDIQALTGNHFFDIRKPRHVQLALRSKDKLYLVVTPETSFAGRVVQETLAQFRISTVFEGSGYGLYELSRLRLEQVAAFR